MFGRGDGRSGGIRRRAAVACVALASACFAVGLPAHAQSPLDELLPPPAQPSSPDIARLDDGASVPLTEPSQDAVARSQNRFDDLAYPGALEVAQNAFPEVVSEPVFDAMSPSDGVRVTEFLGGGTAVVKDNGTQRPLIMDSTLPLKVRDGDQRDPVDLGLQDSAGGDHSPEDPLVPIELDGQKPGGELLDGGARIIVDDTADRDVRVTEDRTFQPNSFTDTDSIVVPTPGGFEVHQIIRSADSPERFWLDVRGVPGARFVELEPSADSPEIEPDGFAIRGADGKTLGYVRDPIAYDAERRPVESRLELDGDRLRLTVEHRGQPIIYPVNADPAVEQAYGGGAAAWAGWHYFANVPSGSGGFAQYLANCSYSCAGHYMFMGAFGAYDLGSLTSSGQRFNPSLSDWTYTSPPGTYVWNADLRGGFHSNGTGCRFLNSAKQYLSNATSCTQAFIGTAVNAYNAWESKDRIRLTNLVPKQSENPYHSPGGFSNGSVRICAPPPENTLGCDPTSTALTDGNRVVYRMQPDNETSVRSDARYIQPTQNVFMRLDYATIFLADRNLPTITSALPGPASAAAAQWTNDQGATRNFTATARDLGFGVETIVLAGASDGGGAKNAACTPSSTAGTCDSPGVPFAFKLDEGLKTLTVTAIDKFNNRSARQTFFAKIDRTGPEIDVSGPLTSQAPIDGMSTPFTVTATDGSSASDATRRSGVKRIDVFFDGTLDRSSDNQPCATDSCPITLSHELDATVAGEGLINVTVEAVDHAGNTSRRTLIPLIDVGPSGTTGPAAQAFARAISFEEPANQGNAANDLPPCTDASQEGCEDLATNPLLAEDLSEADEPVTVQQRSELQPRAFEGVQDRIPAGGWGLSDEIISWCTPKDSEPTDCKSKEKKTDGSGQDVENPGGSLTGIPAPFTDERLNRLDVTWQRQIVPWDIAYVGSGGAFDPQVTCPARGVDYQQYRRLEFAPFERWYREVARRGDRMYISFNKSPCWTKTAQQGIDETPGDNSPPLFDVRIGKDDPCPPDTGKSCTRETEGNPGTDEDASTTYSEALNAFRRRYPGARRFSSWNEPNLKNQTWRHRVADCKKALRKDTEPPDFCLDTIRKDNAYAQQVAQTAGRIWRAAHRECQETFTIKVADGPDPGEEEDDLKIGKCVVLKGEFADAGLGLVGDGYTDEYERGMGIKARAVPWSFHPYETITRRIDAPGCPADNRDKEGLPHPPPHPKCAGSVGNHEEFLKPFFEATRGPVWMTETAAQKFRGRQAGNPVTFFLKPNEDRQVDGLKYMLGEFLQTPSPNSDRNRITRLFYWTFANATCDGDPDDIPSYNEPCDGRPPAQGQTREDSSWYEGAQLTLGSGLVQAANDTPSADDETPRPKAYCLFKRREMLPANRNC